MECEEEDAINAQVVTCSSHVPTQPYYRLDCFLESLRRFAEFPVNLGAGVQWRGLMTKPYLLREWLRQGGATSDRLIVCDAWDVLFLAHPHGVGDRCAELFGDSIVFNGEKGCWPREDLKDAFPNTGDWRFLNSGFFCGPTERIRALLEAIPIEAVGFDPVGGPYPNDQGEYQALFAQQAEHGVDMVVDTQCRVAMTFSATAEEEFEIRDKALYNLVTHTSPGVGHFNGSGMNQHFDKFRTHWGFSERPTTS